MSILCYGCGAFALPIWYSMRLLQWQSLANKYPALLANGVPRGSLQAKFKAALWKLVLGIVVGGLLFLIIAISVARLIMAVSEIGVVTFGAWSRIS